MFILTCCCLRGQIAEAVSTAGNQQHQAHRWPPELSMSKFSQSVSRCSQVELREVLGQREGTEEEHIRVVQQRMRTKERKTVHVHIAVLCPGICEASHEQARTTFTILGAG